MSAAAAKAGAHPTVEINLDSHYSSKVYTSGSAVNGHVVINSPRDIAFDSFEIVFTGATFTRLDFVQQFPTLSCRPFMKLRMPLADSDLPESLVFEAGQTYIVPFNFVVPHNLTLSACTHNVSSPSVRDQHLRLPPTVGYWEADDQAPEMAQVEYAVKARAFKRAVGDSRAVKLMEGVRRIKVLPALGEDAPLDVSFRDERYKLSKSKTIRKGLLASKTGKLTVSTVQPGAVMLSADGHSASTSTARVNVEFTPSSADTQPPKINSVSAKLHALTYFSATSADSLPNLGFRSCYSTNHSLSYSTTTSLFNLPVDKVSWTQEHASMGRRDSGYASSPLDGGSDSDASDAHGRRGSKSKSKKSQTSPIRHVTSLEVPITVPISNKKIFIPTFHSCLVSRAYILQLSVSVGATNTSMTLSVPLQIGVDRIYEPQGGELPSFESVMAQYEEGEADAHMLPRVIQMPPEEMQRGSELPAYGSQAPIRVA